MSTEARRVPGRWRRMGNIAAVAQFIRLNAPARVRRERAHLADIWGSCIWPMWCTAFMWLDRVPPSSSQRETRARRHPKVSSVCVCARRWSARLGETAGKAAERLIENMMGEDKLWPEKKRRTALEPRRVLTWPGVCGAFHNGGNPGRPRPAAVRHTYVGGEGTRGPAAVSADELAGGGEDASRAGLDAASSVRGSGGGGDEGEAAKQGRSGSVGWVVIYSLRAGPLLLHSRPRPPPRRQGPASPTRFLLIFFLPARRCDPDA